MRNYKSKAFTLAEVLITLGIIGIVAAMTIPTLVNNYQQKALDNQFKKAYSMISQALTSARGQFEYLPRCYYHPNGTVGPNQDCNELTANFANMFKVIKTCNDKAYEQGCIPEYEGMDTVANANHPDAEVPEGYESTGEYESRGCTNFRKQYILNNRKFLVLADGIIIGVPTNDGNVLIVDVNGNKGPNKWGYDLFTFMIRSDGNYYKYTGGGCFLAEKGGVGADMKIIRLFN